MAEIRKKELPVSAERIAEVISQTNCNVNAACVILGISRSTYMRWMDRYPTLRLQVAEAFERDRRRRRAQLQSQEK